MYDTDTTSLFENIDEELDMLEWQETQAMMLAVANAAAAASFAPSDVSGAQRKCKRTTHVDSSHRSSLRQSLQLQLGFLGAW